MILGIRKPDFVAGAITVLVGIFTLVEASGYDLGTARKMGPGYFPCALGLLLVGFGLGIMFVEGRRGGETAAARPAIRAAVAIAAAIGAFALLIEPFGLVPAVLVAVFLATLAENRVAPLRSLILGATLALLSALIFPIGLGLDVAVIQW